MLYELIAYCLLKLLIFFFQTSFYWAFSYVNWILGMIDLDRFFELEEELRIFEKLRELLLVANLFFRYGPLKWIFCMLNDESNDLGIIFVYPINDLPSWLGKYEKEIGFSNKLND